MQGLNYSCLMDILHAPRYPSLAVVQLVVSYGAAINAIDFHRKTP